MFTQTSGRHLKCYTAASRTKLSPKRAGSKVKNMLSTKQSLKSYYLNLCLIMGSGASRFPVFIWMNTPTLTVTPHACTLTAKWKQRNLRLTLFKNEEVVHKEPPLILIERTFLRYWPPLLWPWPCRQALSCQWIGHSLPHSRVYPGLTRR